MERWTHICLSVLRPSIRLFVCSSSTAAAGSLLLFLLLLDRILVESLASLCTWYRFFHSLFFVSLLFCIYFCLFFIYDFSLHNSDMFYFCEFRYCRWFHRLLCFYRSNYLLYCTTFVVFSHALTISLIYAYVLNSQILYSFICRICIQAVFISTSDVYIKYYINSWDKK